jgi:CRP/FNR family transcriptional regulator, cyclic AMP receptor protein
MATADRLAPMEPSEGFDDMALAALSERSTVIRFLKGEMIFSPYDPADAAYLVETGRVRVYRGASDGRQLTLAIADEGMLIGRAAMLDQTTHDAYAMAMADCTLRVLRVADLERVAVEHPVVGVELTRELARRLHEAEDMLESLAFRGVPARLASLLLQLMDRYGRVTPDGIRIDERFTHLQLAEMIGTSRETLTKVINELRDAGLIDVRERMVWVLDADGLDAVKRSA